MTELTWSFAQKWNESFENRSERELKPRNHIWASELGGAYVDRWLKMKGVTQTNPPNARSLRKFEAGNLWERILAFVLLRAGILQSQQDWLEFQYPGMLRVTGKLDFLAGGVPDWEKAEASVEEINAFLGPGMTRAYIAIVKHLQTMDEGGLKTIVLDSKAISSFMYDRYESLHRGEPKHEMQVFHYLKAKGMDEAHIVYVCKDDCRMMEVGVTNPGPTEEDYHADIARMSELYRSEERPPLEREVFFNEQTFRFSANWKIEYSNYLTMLYGYETPGHYRERWDKVVANWNRTIGRVVEGKNMTDLNRQSIEEMRKQFPNLDAIVELCRKNSDKVFEKDGGKEG